jgi:hypothetical protein
MAERPNEDGKTKGIHDPGVDPDPNRHDDIVDGGRHIGGGTLVGRRNEQESVTGTHGHGGVDDLAIAGTPEQTPDDLGTAASPVNEGAGGGDDELIELGMSGEDQFPQRLERGGPLAPKASSGPDAGRSDVTSHRDGADAEAIREDDPARRRLSPNDDIDQRPAEQLHDGR